MQTYCDLRIELDATDPVVWRRIILPEQKPLQTLCKAIEHLFDYAESVTFALTEAHDASTLEELFESDTQVIINARSEEALWSYKVTCLERGIENEEQPWRLFVDGAGVAPFDYSEGPELFAQLLDIKRRHDAGEAIEQKELDAFEDLELEDLAFLELDLANLKSYFEDEDFHSMAEQTHVPVERFKRWAQAPLETGGLGDIELFEETIDALLAGGEGLGLSHDQIVVSMTYLSFMVIELPELDNWTPKGNAGVYAAALLTILDRALSDEDDEAKHIELTDFDPIFGFDARDHGAAVAMVESWSPVVAELSIEDVVNYLREIMEAPDEDLLTIEEMEKMSTRERTSYFWNSEVSPESLEFHEQQEFGMFVSCEVIDKSQPLPPGEAEHPDYLFVAHVDLFDEPVNMIPFFGEISRADLPQYFLKFVVATCISSDPRLDARPQAIILPSRDYVAEFRALYGFLDTAVLSVDELDAFERRQEARAQIGGKKRVAKKKKRKSQKKARKAQRKKKK